MVEEAKKQDYNTFFSNSIDNENECAKFQSCAPNRIRICYNSVHNRHMARPTSQ